MKFKWVEHMTQAWDALLEDLFSCVPEESKKHLKNARKEFLHALKSVIEARIAELEKSEKKELKKIKIEKSEE